MERWGLGGSKVGVERWAGPDAVVRRSEWVIGVTNNWNAGYEKFLTCHRHFS